MFENMESGLTTDEGMRASEFNEVYESAPVEAEPQTTGRWALRGRLRSRVLWASVVGLIMVVFSAFGLWERIGITADGFREIVGAVGGVLAAFGVFNDPTNREGF